MEPSNSRSGILRPAPRVRGAANSRNRCDSYALRQLGLVSPKYYCDTVKIEKFSAWERRAAYLKSTPHLGGDIPGNRPLEGSRPDREFCVIVSGVNL
jgi:hypothetical protein